VDRRGSTVNVWQQAAHSGAGRPIQHLVIFVQENHTTDNYFRSMAAYGANVTHPGERPGDPATAESSSSKQSLGRYAVGRRPP
jgi:phospholipase C